MGSAILYSSLAGVAAALAASFAQMLLFGEMNPAVSGGVAGAIAGVIAVNVSKKRQADTD